MAAALPDTQALVACRCNKSAPVSAPNCAYCCNFSCYNEPIGGQWPSGLKPAKGDNALGDGQLFWYALHAALRMFQ